MIDKMHTLFSQAFARVRAEELEKAWWSEQGELSSGPAAAGKNAVPEDEAASTKWQVPSMHHGLHHLLSMSSQAVLLPAMPPFVQQNTQQHQNRMSLPTCNLVRLWPG